MSRSVDSSTDKQSEQKRRDKRYFVMVANEVLFKKARGQSHRAFGPFHKRQHAARWASDNLAVSFVIMHMEVP